MNFSHIQRCIGDTRLLSALLALALGAGCSASAEDRDGSEAGGLCPDGSDSKQDQCPKDSEKPEAEALLDDLEDTDGLIPNVRGRAGAWWTAGDDTVTGTIVPAANTIAPAEAIPGGRCDSKFGMRVTGQGFLDWGSLLGVDLVYGSRSDGSEGTLPYDASAYTGVEFWARIGDTSSDRVRFAVSDVNNEPYGGVCEEGTEPYKQCFDTFGTYLNGLGPEWRHYRIAFTSLGQRQFGYPAAAAATDQLFSVQFNFDPSSIFDFWVDDVAFY
jgi:hypothetical protein